MEQYEKAKEILTKLLDEGYETTSIQHHLAGICLITERNADAEKYVGNAWECKSEAKPYIVARLIWFIIVFAFLEIKSLKNYPGQLKAALQKEDVFMEWTMQPVLDHIKPQIEEQQHALLSALVDAMSNKANMGKLEDFEEWRDAKLEELD